MDADPLFPSGDLIVQLLTTLAALSLKDDLASFQMSTSEIHRLDHMSALKPPVQILDALFEAVTTGCKLAAHHLGNSSSSEQECSQHQTAAGFNSLCRLCWCLVSCINQYLVFSELFSSFNIPTSKPNVSHASCYLSVMAAQSGEAGAR
jgi:hypothetical protein